MFRCRAMPALTELLNDKDYDHADVAVAMLVIDADGSKPALEWVRKVLTDKDNHDLYDLIELLPQLGAAAKPLIPELITDRSNESPTLPGSSNRTSGSR